MEVRNDLLTRRLCRQERYRVGLFMTRDLIAVFCPRRSVSGRCGLDLTQPSISEAFPVSQSLPSREALSRPFGVSAKPGGRAVP